MIIGDVSFTTLPTHFSHIRMVEGLLQRAVCNEASVRFEQNLAFSRDANHSDFCRIISIFKSDFHIMISDIKILANNDFQLLLDKIKEVALLCRLVWKKLYLFTGSKIGMFPF